MCYGAVHALLSYSIKGMAHPLSLFLKALSSLGYITLQSEQTLKASGSLRRRRLFSVVVCDTIVLLLCLTELPVNSKMNSDLLIIVS